MSKTKHKKNKTFKQTITAIICIIIVLIMILGTFLIYL